LLLYKAIIKSIWAYGIQLWDTASNSNIEILQRFQNKFLRIIDASWYVTNDTLHHDLNVPYIRDEITRFSQRYTVGYFYQDGIVKYDGSSMSRIDGTISKETLDSSLQRYNISR